MSSPFSELNTPDLIQLDLFLNSRAVVLANDVIHALLARDAARASVALERLRVEEPQHHLLGAMNGLRGTLDAWPFPAASASDIERTIRLLESEVQSMAHAAIGENATDFMLPFWRDLAQAPGAHVYEPVSPQAYRAALYLRCGDSETAATAAQAIARAEDNIDALHWLSIARYRTGGLVTCRGSLMRLALLAPERIPGTLDEIDDALLFREWHAFQAALDPEDGTAGAWFPAWHLVEHPGTAIEFGSPLTLPETAPIQVMKTIARLLKVEKGGYSPALVSARSRLRNLDSKVFDFYMAHCNVSHP